MKRKRKSPLVECQTTKIIDYQKGRDEGERTNIPSPYNSFVQLHKTNSDGHYDAIDLEDRPANRLWGCNTPPELAGLIIERFMDDKGSFPALSKKQNQVLRLYTAGLSVPEIALELKQNKSTVHRSIVRIGNRFRKLLASVQL